jgi:hypothetical protein
MTLNLKIFDHKKGWMWFVRLDIDFIKICWKLIIFWTIYFFTSIQIFYILSTFSKRHFRHQTRIGNKPFEFLICGLSCLSVPWLFLLLGFYSNFRNVFWKLRDLKVDLTNIVCAVFDLKIIGVLFGKMWFSWINSFNSKWKVKVQQKFCLNEIKKHLVLFLVQQMYSGPRKKYRYILVWQPK